MITPDALRLYLPTPIPNTAPDWKHMPVICAVNVIEGYERDRTVWTAQLEELRKKYADTKAHYKSGKHNADLEYDLAWLVEDARKAQVSLDALERHVNEACRFLDIDRKELWFEGHSWEETA